MAGRRPLPNPTPTQLRRRIHSAKKYAERVESGDCVDCGATVKAPGERRCAACADDNNARAKASYRKSVGNRPIRKYSKKGDTDND